MFKHEIFSLLRTFSKNELRKFDSFLKSPYFNNSKKLAVLYEEIVRFHPLYSHKKLTKEWLYKSINKNGQYVDSTMRSMLSRLMNLGQKFILYEHFDTNEMELDNVLLEAMSRKNLGELLNKKIDIVGRKLNSVKKIDTNFFSNKIRYETTKINNNLLNARILSQKDVDKDITDLFNRGLHLTFNYVCEVISEYSILFSFRKNFNIAEKSILLERLIRNIRIGEMIEIIGTQNKYSFILELYRSLFLAFSEEKNDENYFTYKGLIETHIEKLSQNEVTFHYSKLINYCVMKSTTNKKFKLELFHIYNTYLINEYYKNNKTKFLPLALYRNILIQGINLKKFDWTENFIKVYTYKVHRDEIDNMLNFGYAYYYNATGKYQEAMEHLNKLRPDFFRFKTDYRNISLTVYYELNFYEEALYLVQSYRKFLKRNDMVTNERKKSLRNFLHYLEKLILFKTGEPKIDLPYLKDKVLNSDNTFNKNWLIEKMDSAMKKQHKE